MYLNSPLELKRTFHAICSICKDYGCLYGNVKQMKHPICFTCQINLRASMKKILNKVIVRRINRLLIYTALLIKNRINTCPHAISGIGILTIIKKYIMTNDDEKVDSEPLLIFL